MKHVIATIAILWRQLPYSKCLLPPWFTHGKCSMTDLTWTSPLPLAILICMPKWQVKYLYFMHFQPFLIIRNLCTKYSVEQGCLFWKVCPIADYEKNICGSPGKRSNIIPSRILSALPSLTCYSPELPLRVGLMRDMWTHEYLMCPWSAYEPHP